RRPQPEHPGGGRAPPGRGRLGPGGALAMAHAVPAPVRILQFGEGNFLRAFIDWMVDRMRTRAGYDGSVLLVKTIPGPFSPDFARQDDVFTVLLRGRQGDQVVEERSRIAVVSGRVNPYEDFQGYLEAGANPDL